MGKRAWRTKATPENDARFHKASALIDHVHALPTFNLFLTIARLRRALYYKERGLPIPEAKEHEYA